MFINGARHVIEYSRVDKMFHVLRLGDMSTDPAQELPNNTFSNYLLAEKESKTRFLFQWASAWIDAHRSELAHFDSVVEEVIRESHEGPSGEWYAFVSSHSHQSVLHYWVLFDESPGRAHLFIPRTLELSEMDECHACEIEDRENHPRPEDVHRMF